MITKNKNGNVAIIKFYSYSFLSNLLFFLPIVVMFFKDCNLNFTEIFILETVGAAAVVLLEVPTGAIADYFGKKLSLMIGMLVLISACILFYLGSGFLVFALAQLIWALGYSMLSGADVALLYDMLQDNKKENFKKYRGTANFIGLTGISLSSLVGGYIASYSMRFTFVFTAMAFLICFIIILSIKHTSEEERQKSNYLLIIKDSFMLIKNSRWILWLFLFSGVFGAVFKIAQPLTQVYMNLSGLDIKFFGIASTYFFLMAAISSKFADAFEKKFKHWSYSILGSLLIFSIFIISLNISKAGFLLFGIIFSAMSITSIIVEHELLKTTPSTKHSTVLSFNNLFYRLIFAMSSPIFGYSLGAFNFQKTMLMTSGILLITVPIFIISYRRIL